MLSVSNNLGGHQPLYLGLKVTLPPTGEIN